uniref:Death ligand signal enhancer n=1 Tax=Cacopsylla melanoneura TaxID=428564 RepID=A0A8D8U261_9HEMI
MWRFISRGVRDFKHSPSKPVDATENVQKQKPYIVKKRKTCSLLNYKAWAPSSFQWTNSTGKSEQSSHNSQDQIHYNHTLFEAFGWSGAIVFGWYIGQSLIRNRNYFFSKKDFEDKRRAEFKYRTLSDVVTKVVLAQPQYCAILPTESYSTLTTSQHDSESYRLETTNPAPVEWYGPITKEDNFNQIGLELLDVHKEMIAELENVRGMKLLKKKKMTDAISHFKQALLLNHPTAAFNLAQCYENGWGTEQDYSQAVFYYEKAKAQGHASAIYNLGVYYSRGLGGLNTDADKANELFLMAAKLGHAEAAQITGLVKCPAPSLEDLSKMFEDQNSMSPYPGQLVEAVESYMKSNDITPDEAYHSDEPESPLWDTFVKEVNEYNQLWDKKETGLDKDNSVPFVF